jgi:hypothetical protein
MAPDKTYQVTLENVDIPRFMRNFAGAPGPFNAAGVRSFCVLLDEADLLRIDQEYWHLKELRPREEGDLPRPYLQVAARWPKPTDKFQGQPPTVVMITDKIVTLPDGSTEIRKCRTTLDESMVMLLDWATITNADLIVRPHEWTVNGKSGVKAYLKALYVTIESDELEMKYADVPDANNHGMVFETVEDGE